VVDPEMAKSSYTMETITMFANLASLCSHWEQFAAINGRVCEGTPTYFILQYESL